MVPDAEAKLDEVLEKLGNQRDSVLFKLERDPRRTKVGRILESTSFDEVPQLFNVLNGTMSLVGPRPALATEVAKFDDELLARLSVPPGVTGLWQVEARDNPSFSAYKRLDLFYVENWSLTLDLVLLVETFSSVVARMSRRRS
jgi:lipopolysaccharide/colanic/teichoic acid biosynthesis glycosyltransferase